MATGDNYYANHDLDTYLNDTWYNSLSATAKSAIVDKNIVQYAYPYYSAGYNADTHASYAGYASKAVHTTPGDRHVYAIDVEDIEKYFGGTDSTPGTFSTADIWTLFWNQSTQPDTITYPWLRSAFADFDSNSAFSVYGSLGYVRDYNADGSLNAARPAFQIDLTKIAWTPAN